MEGRRGDVSPALPDRRRRGFVVFERPPRPESPTSSPRTRTRSSSRGLTQDEPRTGSGRLIRHLGGVMPMKFADGKTPIEQLRVSAYKIPTDAPESDGTYEWKETTLVLVEAVAGEVTGLGYSYADTATACLIRDKLAEVVRGQDAMGVPGLWALMVASIRNLGRPGIASMAISAVDSALWDLKSRLLGLPLVTLLGAVHDSAPVYGSGGFTSYSEKQLKDQLAGWVAAGITRVKMKIGRHPQDDLARVHQARDAIGPSVELFVDANGA